jgi:threonine dehydrogenase-like Zn-dependent dehydrogenase
VSDFTVSYGDVFMAEMTMIAPRDCQARDISAALELMRTGKLRVGDLITKVMTPDEAPEAYAMLRDRKDQAMTIAFRWK